MATLPESSPRETAANETRSLPASESGAGVGADARALRAVLGNVSAAMPAPVSL